MPLSRHPAFRPVTDPATGVTAWCPARPLAPVTQHFYYTNPSVSADGCWLWFICAFPPNPQKTLAAIALDPADGRVLHFPQAGFSSASPCVCPEGDAAWFTAGPRVWRLGVDGSCRVVAELPAAWLAGRHLWRLATHLSLSADGRHLVLDGQAGDTWFLALVEVATGKVEVVQEFQENHNHALCSPIDPDLILIARDHCRFPASGRFVHHMVRSHLIRRDGTGYRCINPEFPCRPHHGACHEWFTAAGTVAFIDYDSGVWEWDPATGISTHVWKEPLCHAHASPCRRWWVADQSPYFWSAERPCRVILFDRSTGATRDLLRLPPPRDDRSAYHLDPHPQISPDGRWIVVTSTLDAGRCEPALIPLSAVAGD